MCGMVPIGGKLLSILEAAENMNDICLDIPFEVAIIIVDGCEGSIRCFSQEITESEAI